MIFHITQTSSWQAAKLGGIYRAPSLETEGFIHFSTAEQLVATANRFYQGQSNLVVLVVQRDLLDAELREEDVPGHGTFPHLYGPLNVSAVTEILPLVPQADGQFVMPDFQS